MAARIKIVRGRIGSPIDRELTEREIEGLLAQGFTIDIVQYEEIAGGSFVLFVLTKED